MADLLAQYGIPLGALIYVALCLKAVGFMVRDELVLRLLVVSGMLIGVTYYALRPEPVWDSFLADCVLIAINLTLIGVIVLERTTFSMKPIERKLFRALGTLNPGQFRKLARKAHWDEATEDRILISEGGTVERLYFIDAPEVTIVKGGVARGIEGPVFAGEIVLLRGGLASATVRIDRGAMVASWSMDELQKIMDRSRPMHNALIARFSLDLAIKVARGMPMDQADLAE